LQEVISPAISQGIADNKEKMIDALYPIMGGMISKYVTQAIREMMETINKKIEQGFSVARYKRKIKARLTGVSESELLLEESIDAHIAAMFIIHKETGLLVSEAHLEDSHIGDPHMVASMASAIKDFINDWIADNQHEKKEIQILSYGNATLYIESAGSVYIIAFLDSEPDYEQRSEINTFFASLLAEYADFFQTFDGDDSTKEVSDLSEKMYTYLKSQENENGTTAARSKRKNPAKIIFFILGLVLLLYAAYTVKEYYNMQTLQMRIEKETGEKVSVVKRNGLYFLEGALNDPSHFQPIVKTVEQSGLEEKIQPYLYLTVAGALKSEEQTVSRLLENQKRKFQQQQTEFETRLRAFEKKTEEKLAALAQREESLEKTLKVLTGRKDSLRKLLKIKEDIAESLQNAMKGNPYYNMKRQTLNFALLHLFEEGRPEPGSQKMEEVNVSFKKYLKALLPYKTYIGKITVTAYSDSKGNAESNLVLTRERAQKVVSYLKTQPYVSQYGMMDFIEAVGKGESDPVMVDGKEDHDASRRVVIAFTLDQKKLKSDIGKLLN